ncbi:MAG: YIP1 family protein [Acidobacteria bacterium]|nr:YIP1 family protein [Acidobacteriota bacterium]
MEQPEDQNDNSAPLYSAPPVHPPEAPEEPARMRWFQRFFGVLISPGETFADVNRKPTIIAPILIAIAIAIIGASFFSWRVKPDWERFVREGIKKQEAKSGQTFPPEQVEAQVKGTVFVGKIFPVIAAIITPIGYVILAGVYALGMMLIQAKATFKKILSVVAWSNCAVSVVGTVVLAASLMARDRESLNQINPMQPGSITATNLSLLLPEGSSAAITALASSFDLFTIWVLIVLSIGLAAIAGSRKIKTGKTATLVFGIWFLWILIGAGLASFRS